MAKSKDSGANEHAAADKAVGVEGLRLHDLGFWIVPVSDKGAFWENWPTVRRNREDLVSALQEKNIGIALVLNQTDWIDVECDTAEAEANLQAMFAGMIPPTPTWQSARGKHRLFVRPEGLPEKAKLELDGIEFRI